LAGDLAASDGNAPTFLVSAMKDPNGANLDRVQIIKGWISDRKLQKQIFDVACAGRNLVKASCDGDVGNTVDIPDASYTNDIGDAQLSAVWTDPEFDPAQHAVYYARVLEIPTPRWSTYDAKTLGPAPLGQRTDLDPGTRLDIADLVRTRAVDRDAIPKASRGAGPVMSA
jgi:hypothetical protein